MDNMEEASVLDSVHGLAEAQCVDGDGFIEPDCVENEEFGNSDSSSSSEDETESEPLVDFSSDELVDNCESLTPLSPLDSDASEDVSDHSTTSLKKTDEEVDQVDFTPDFIIFNNIYARNACVIFSENCIEAKGLDVCTGQDDFNVQLKLDDVVNIESMCIERTAMVKIRVVFEGSVDTESDHSISDMKELMFAVTDFSWFVKREYILSLNPRYEALWTSVMDTGFDEYGDMSFPANYIPSFNPFEDFIYPEGDSDAVSISKRDVDLLEPERYVNDTIIDFYIKYLKDRIPPDKRQRFHFFNSFFFRKLDALEKYSSTSFDGRAAFLRVRKWTRKFNLFQKDFVFVPINYHSHWSLIVICYPGEISTFTDVDIGKLAKVPCILHMDSIRGTHLDLECRIRSYLWEEWKERQKEVSEDVASKFSNLRFVSLELPQQQNSYDCGIFLLHYVELFLDEDPVGINPFKISKSDKFLNADWFPSTEPSLKRRAIQKLIHNLLENQSQEPTPVFASDTNKPENALEFLTASFGHGKEGCNGELTSPQAKETVENFPTSLGGSLCIDLSGVSARDLFNDSVQEVKTCGTYDQLESKENGSHNSLKIKTEALKVFSWDQDISLCNDNSALEVVRKDETFQDKQETAFNDELLVQTTKQISNENEMVAVAVAVADVNDKPDTSPGACENITPEDLNDCNNDERKRSINRDDSGEHVAKKLRFTNDSEECPKSLPEDLCL